MKKSLAYIFLILSNLTLFAQTSEDLIPNQALTVFSINNMKLLTKISMDELVQYEFMSEVQSEIFDGSTNNKTLKDAGIDFDQKLNLFYGQNTNYEISGFTFGVKDTNLLFSVFDDFERIIPNSRNVIIYRSNNNYFINKGNSALILRVEPSPQLITSITDSIWFARGNDRFIDSSLFNQNDYYEDDDYEFNVPDSKLQEVEEVYIMDDNNFELDSLDLRNKNYYELKDSISYSLQQKYLTEVITDLFIKDLNLKKTDHRFSEQLKHDKDGVFFLNNGSNIGSVKVLWQFQALFPDLFNNLEKLYSANYVVADIELENNSIDIKLTANYGEELGKIYQKLNTAKFDSNVLNYIHKDAAGFFTYNINLKEGYKQAFDIIIPILSEEKDPRISTNVLIAELINEYVNTDALFDTYKGSMFGSFNGIKKVKTKKITYYYDESFQYGEREEEIMEDMPVFTLGFSTKRSDIPEKILKHISRMTTRFEKHDGYWKIEEAIFNSLPLYIINKKSLFILTNDEDLVLNNSNGFGKNALSGKLAKNAKKSKFLYGYLNSDQAINNLPREFFNAKQNQIIQSIKGKSGYMELNSLSINKNQSFFDVNYKFENENNVGKHLLDVINSIYILSK